MFSDGPLESRGWFGWLLVTALIQGLLWATAAFACLMPVAKIDVPSGVFRTIGERVERVEQSDRIPLYALVFLGVRVLPVPFKTKGGIWVKIVYPSSTTEQAGIDVAFALA